MNFRFLSTSGLLLVLNLMALLAAAGTASAAEYRFETKDRIVAVGDVHGAYTELTALLRATQLVDEQLRWTGGQAQLVSVGDLLDRGADSRATMDLLMRLQEEASIAGGRVHVVLGNHELMNLVGDLRYVSEGEFQSYVSKAGQQAFTEHRAAFAATGKYGAWLLERPTVISVNGNLFLHGGLSSLATKYDLDELNNSVKNSLRAILREGAKRIAAGNLPVDADLLEAAEAAANTGEKSAFVQAGTNPLLGAQGPMWYRGNVYCHPQIEEQAIDQVLQHFNAQRIIVGHTPTKSRIPKSQHSGKLLRIDTGMLRSHYRGNPFALQIADGQVTTINLEGQIQPIGRLSRYPEHALEALLSGTLSKAQGDNIYSVKLAGKPSLRAEFLPLNGKQSDRELAAFAVSEGLDLQFVPPTVKRVVGGRTGLLQLRNKDWRSHREALERQRSISNWCDNDSSFALLATFDWLTNQQRTADNLLYNFELNQVVAVAHHNAFGSARVPRSASPLATSLGLKLRALTEQQVQNWVGDSLSRREVKRLLKRRDEILRQIAKQEAS